MNGLFYDHLKILVADSQDFDRADSGNEDIALRIDDEDIVERRTAP